MKDFADKCVDRYFVNWHAHPPINCAKVSTPCLDDHQLANDDFEIVGELADGCARHVLQCLSIARICGPDILWKVNALARAVTAWNRACHKSLARLTDLDIFNARRIFDSFIMSETASECKLGFFQDADFAILFESILSQHLVECSAYWVIIHRYQFLDHASNRRQWHTAMQKLR